jgi:hypothetical protein
MSRVKKLLYVALGLAVVALIVNGLDPNHFLLRWLKGESTWRAQYVRHFTSAKPIEPVGSPNAKVHIQLFVQSMNPCHAATVDLLKKVGEALPKRVRVEFLDTMTPEGFEARQRAAIPCEVGLLINHQKTMQIQYQGRTFQFSFHGPIGMGMSPELLERAVEQELKKHYGKEITKEEWAKFKAVWKELPRMVPKGHGMGPGIMGPGPMMPPGEGKPPASKQGGTPKPGKTPAGPSPQT